MLLAPLLDARVVRAEAVGTEDYASLVEIEVTNRGTVGAEPLVFGLDPGTRVRPSRVLRVDAPHYGRAGRVVPAGGATVYPLLVTHGEKRARRLEIQVPEASFVQGGTRWEELPLVVGRLDVTREVDPVAGKTLPRTAVALTNRLDLAVDAIFRAEFIDPLHCTTLIRVHLPPAETTTLVQSQLPVTSDFYHLGAEIRRLELVDWSVIVEDGDQAGRAPPAGRPDRRRFERAARRRARSALGDRSERSRLARRGARAPLRHARPGCRTGRALRVDRGHGPAPSRAGVRTWNTWGRGRASSC